MKASIKYFATRTALLALTVAGSVTFASAQDNSASPPHSITIAGGQGGLVFIPDTRPAPQSFALTGEPSTYRQTLQAWHAQAGPVYSVGNARIVVSPTR